MKEIFKGPDGQAEIKDSLKDRIKKATAIGATAFVIGGVAAEANKAYADEAEKGKISISEGVKDKTKEPKAKFEQVAEMAEKERVVEIKEEAKQIRDKLIKHFSGKEFLNKLKIEYDDNEKLAKEVQAKDIERLSSIKLEVLIFDDFEERLKKFALIQNAAGYYLHKDNNVVVDSSYSREFIDEAILHELLHATTISEKAKKILEDSYAKQGFLSLFKNKEDEYLGRTEERIVRKRLVDYDMERLGIKKYSEKLTREHYDKLMDAYKQKKLSYGSVDFIRTTQPKFEYFEKIFNEIAQKENSSEIKQV